MDQFLTDFARAGDRKLLVYQVHLTPLCDRSTQASEDSQKPE